MWKYAIVLAAFVVMSIQAQAQDFQCQKFIKRSGSVFFSAKETCGVVDDYGGGNCVIEFGIQIVPLNETVSDFIDHLPNSGSVCVKGTIVEDVTHIQKLMAYEIRSN
jgi:hypothetical protein